MGAMLDSFITTGAVYSALLRAASSQLLPCRSRVEAQQETSKINTVAHEEFKKCLL